VKNIALRRKQEKPPKHDITMERPDKTMYFLDIALSVARRSTCIRRKFGAVIVKGNTIVGTGYNGNARGVVNCNEIGCIKNIMESPQGMAYDYCPAVHAEENAIINSNRTDRIDATLYIAGINKDGKYTIALPCQRCQRKIINSQIHQVIILRDDGKPMTIDVQEYIKSDTDWYTQLIKETNKYPKNL
jgi:dCMP deaminase